MTDDTPRLHFGNNGNWIDLSPHIAGAEVGGVALTSADLTADESEYFSTRLDQKLGGLRDTSFTVSGTWDGARMFPMTIEPKMDVTYVVPKNRWHAFLQKLARHWSLRWIKPKTITYTLAGVQVTVAEDGTP